MRVRHPPGRGGRVWLHARYAVASRAAELLEQKERVLVREQRRLRVLIRRTEAAWEEASNDARTWAARTAALEGRRAIALVAVPGIATADLTWRNSMGAYYPYRATAVLPPERSSEGWSTAAMAETIRAERAALACAVEHAATRRASDEVERELLATRHRLRMLRHRLLPTLETTMRTLEVAIEEHERDDAARARWASERREDSR